MKKVFLAVAALALLIQTGVRADVFMKQKHHTDAFQMMGRSQPAKDAEETMWIAKDMVRNDQGETSSILRLDKKTLTMLNHQKKTYSEIPLDFDKISKEMTEGTDQSKEGMPPGMPDMMKNMMKFKMTVTPAGESKKIGQWNCKKYQETLETGMSKTESVIWASEDIKIDPELYTKLSTAMLAMMPGFKESMADLIKEAKKIKGVYVRTEASTTIMGNAMNTTTELLEIKEGTAPAGIFDPPADYKQVKFEGMGGRRH
jgi:hypothetical protein